jgi:hypothetical protein
MRTAQGIGFAASNPAMTVSTFTITQVSGMSLGSVTSGGNLVSSADDPSRTVPAVAVKTGATRPHLRLVRD